MEPAIRCGFHVRNPSDADADLLHDQNSTSDRKLVKLVPATAI